MKSLKEIYRIGKGPSSSHTMGPQKAAQIFASRNNGVSLFVVTLYGSLAATGRGHMTDVAIRDVLEPLAPVDILWEPSVFLPYHPNGMKFEARDAEGHTLDEWTVYSIGGGAYCGDICRQSNAFRTGVRKGLHGYRSDICYRQS